jgi:ABC-type glycerol-3-phosphate transport system permease component
MNPTLWAAALSIALFLGMVACLEAGFRIGLRSSTTNPELAHEGIGVIEAAVFALLGLLLGFSFAGGTSRLDTRRQLIVQEANAMGTAYLRLDLFPGSEQPEMRHLFRDYLDARLQVYDDLSDRSATDRAIIRVAQIQQQIWSRAVSASRADPYQNVARVSLPALNEMIDITTTRMIALRTHLPVLIFALLTCVALLSGLLAGYAMARRKSRSWMHMLLYAAVISSTVYTLLDLDSPRSGFIHLDAADAALRQLKDSLR